MTDQDLFTEFVRTEQRKRFVRVTDENIVDVARAINATIHFRSNGKPDLDAGGHSWRHVGDWIDEGGFEAGNGDLPNGFEPVKDPDLDTEEQIDDLNEAIIEHALTKKTLDRVTDLFEKWAVEETEHRIAEEYGIAEGLKVASDDLRTAVHGETRTVNLPPADERAIAEGVARTFTRPIKDQPQA